MVAVSCGVVPVVFIVSFIPVLLCEVGCFGSVISVPFVGVSVPFVGVLVV